VNGKIGIPNPKLKNSKFQRKNPKLKISNSRINSISGNIV
jgi:hypothetical protein